MATTTPTQSEPRTPVGIWRPWELSRVLVEELTNHDTYAWRLFAPQQPWVLYLSANFSYCTWEHEAHLGRSAAEVKTTPFANWEHAEAMRPLQMIGEGPPQTVTALDGIADETERLRQADLRMSKVPIGSLWLWTYQPARQAVLRVTEWGNWGGGPYSVEFGDLWIPTHAGEPVSEEYRPPRELYLGDSMPAERFVTMAERGELVRLATIDRLPWVL